MESLPHPLRSKTALVGVWFVLFGALALWAAQRLELALCADARHAVIRELTRAGEPAEVLFFGSSQTARGVLPQVFDARASELAGREVRSFNLSTFGHARHIAFLTLARWLRVNPPPRAVYVECGVLSDAPEYAHDTLARFMDPPDALRVLANAPYVARDAADFKRRKDHPERFDVLGLFSALERRQLNMEIALDALGRGPEDCVRAAFNLAVRGGAQLYWKPNEPQFDELVGAQVAERGYFRVAPESELGVGGKVKVTARAARIGYEEAVTATWTGVDEFADPARFSATRLYAREISALCRERGIELVFLDQPNFRGRPLRPAQVEFYRSLGELFVQDKAVLYREESFQDDGHLSVAGAEFASRALAEHYAAKPR